MTQKPCGHLCCDVFQEDSIAAKRRNTPELSHRVARCIRNIHWSVFSAIYTRSNRLSSTLTYVFISATARTRIGSEFRTCRQSISPTAHYVIYPQRRKSLEPDVFWQLKNPKTAGADSVRRRLLARSNRSRATHANDALSRLNNTQSQNVHPWPPLIGPRTREFSSATAMSPVIGSPWLTTRRRRRTATSPNDRTRRHHSINF